MRDRALTRECALLHRYLLGTAPSMYVVERYTAAHEHLAALTRGSGWFDDFLLNASHLHPFVLRLIQVYVRIFAPQALVRKKAVLLLAVIECCAPSLVSIQAARTSRPLIAISWSVLAVGKFAVQLVLAAIVLAPIHLASSALGKAVRQSPVPATARETA